MFFARLLIVLLGFFCNIALASHLPDDPEYVALVDTGYDACINAGGTNCSANKNLLFRGGQPIPFDPPYTFNFDTFRGNMWTYIQDFKKNYNTKAALPASLNDLSQYRIVVINLMYDFNQQGYQGELDEVENEFKESGAVTTLQLPEQHKMYGLEKAFSATQYAFEWWPVTFADRDEQDPEFINQSVNWPDKNPTPIHSFEPQVYVPLDLTYFISGKTFGNDKEDQAKDLHTLLATIPQDGHPLLIFYHCLAGKDRTGVVSLSYFMQYGGYPYIGTQKQSIRSEALSLSEALIATTLPDHEPSDDAKRIAKGYCLSLGKNKEYCTL